MFLTMHAPQRIGRGDGKPPVAGVIGMAVCLVVLLALGQVSSWLGHSREQINVYQLITAKPLLELPWLLLSLAYLLISRSPFQ